ncbi:MAG: FtsW/RodA/SpoVE family cell cycle protein, partial [Clostridia bacterium]|nr:FtsW/RodA/SpoVE family cell cycle protein [Clostridia bacterium]
MINIVVELSKYVILTLMIVYTFFCFYMVKKQNEEEKKESLRKQLTLIFFMDFTAFLVIFLKTYDIRVVIFYGEMMAYFAIVQILYRLIYKKASMLLLNNMCMLLSIGFIMLCRLDIDSATRQLVIVAGGSAIALVIPVIIRKMKFLKNLTWVYAGLGIVLLAAVFLLAQTSYGAKLSLMGIQPSEAIKITFVFFMAALLWRDVTFKKVVQATIVAGLHVGILVLSRDLGSAVIFFVAY